MAKNRTTKKSGPSRRSKKISRLVDLLKEQEIHENLRKAFVKIGDHKGFSSQDRFERIFTGNFLRPNWFAGIRRATKYEDFYEGTDFFIITKNYGEIRFDVKSSFYHYQKQIELQEKLPIFVWGVVIQPSMSDSTVLKVVFTKCEIHIARLRREVYLGRFNSRIA